MKAPLIEEMKSFWKYFKGKKRNIGIVAIWGLRAVTLAFPELLIMEHQMIIRDGIDIFLVGSAFDAFTRTDKGKEIINRAIKSPLNK